jgi:uncharacterized protein YjiS (DUF1127 family)
LEIISFAAARFQRDLPSNDEHGSSIRVEATMAMADLASHDWTAALAPLAGWPDAARGRERAGVIQRVMTRYLDWRAQRETVRLLNGLDGATLRDLGIADVDSQVYGAPEGRRRPYDPDWWRKKRG